MDFREILKELAEKNNLLNEEIEIKIADTKLDISKIRDYPLMSGKEVLLRANFKGCYGDAFTDKPKEFVGTIEELIKNGNRAELIAAINAVMRYLNFVDKTVHCTGDEPEKCAKELVKYLKELKPKKIGIIGFQPAFVKEIVNNFGTENVIVSDLNPENIGKIKYGAKIIHGKYNEDLIKNSDVILATGSTIVNGTFEDIFNLAKKYNKKIIFYGTSIAGLAKLLNLERFCIYGR
ncbi:Rossmann-like domain-containing protein [Methanocaldococcus indicus]|uniref:Rossmann-like domain-containing protein n=1 Tax=Methanocaldococcus indicus TaxID=213231 RepID=UPI003C6D6B85